MILQYLSKCKSPDLQKQKIKSIDVLKNINGIKHKVLFMMGRIFPNPAYVSSRYKISHKPLVFFYYPLLYADYIKKAFKVITRDKVDVS
jgi:hypothetical protein